jgi:hypothetical protein
MCKILANMTQVSDVAPGPLVFIVYSVVMMIFTTGAEGVWIG